MSLDRPKVPKTDEVTLESWKEIAEYLQRNTTTARRWEKDEGLPVHRHSHKSRNSVYAYPGEIDAWRASRKAVSATVPVNSWWRLPVLAATILMCVVMVGNGVRSASAQAIGAAGNGGIALRKVWTGGDSMHSVSLDGRWMTRVDFSSAASADQGRLLLRDLVAGTDRALTRSTEGNVYCSAISRNGTQVAYAWRRSGDRHTEFRIASLQGDGVTQDRRLLESEEGVCPGDWSPDALRIAVTVRRADHTAQIGLVSTKDGSLQVLKSVDWRGPGKIAFSPDGKDIAFDLPENDTSNRRDVFLLAVDGSREVPVVLDPSNDIVMGWSPDGKHLLFASDRNGSMGLWALGFANRKPQGSPHLVKTNIGSMRALGVTRAGNLYLAADGGDSDIEVASIDLHSGKQIAAPVRPVQTFVGSNAEPSWSRDGKYLAYVSERGAREYTVAIRSVATGQVRELALHGALKWMVGLSWAPDGRSFAVFGTDAKGRQGVFRIDAQSGTVVPIVVPTPERLSYEGFSWSPDGKRLYYHSMKGAIFERDLDSGNEREVIRGYEGPISLSPDGRWIATAKAEPDTKSTAVVLIPVAGGEPRELLRVTNPQWINITAMPWTPDGSSVLVRKMLVDGGKTSELWLVSVADTPPRKLDFDANRVKTYAPGKIRLHPDGRHIAYVIGDFAGEVWVLENFLAGLNETKY